MSTETITVKLDLPGLKVLDAAEFADRLEIAAECEGEEAICPRCGDPNCEALPKWLAFDAKDRATMVFDTPCHLENDPRSEERLAWKGWMVYR